jgi:hypothetical protein
MIAATIDSELGFKGRFSKNFESLMTLKGSKIKNTNDA